MVRNSIWNSENRYYHFQIEVFGWYVVIGIANPRSAFQTWCSQMRYKCVPITDGNALGYVFLAIPWILWYTLGNAIFTNWIAQKCNWDRQFCVWNVDFCVGGKLFSSKKTLMLGKSSLILVASPPRVELPNCPNTILAANKTVLKQF